MNVSGDASLRHSSKPGSVPVPTDPAQFTKALQSAVTYLQTVVVPAANEAGQMALAKKKEKDSIYRVSEVEEMKDDGEVEPVHKIVQQIAARIRTIAEIERKTLGL